MIDTIQAKLSLIKEIDKSLDESLKEENIKNDNNYIDTGQSDIEEKTEENNEEE